MTEAEHNNLIKKVNTWTIDQLPEIDFSIMALKIAEADPEAIEIFEQRRKELVKERGVLS